MAERYKIVRYYAPGSGREKRVIKRGLTLEQAQAWCKREDTHEKGPRGTVKWFDGYTQE